MWAHLTQDSREEESGHLASRVEGLEPPETGIPLGPRVPLDYEQGRGCCRAVCPRTEDQGKQDPGGYGVR